MSEMRSRSTAVTAGMAGNERNRVSASPHWAVFKTKVVRSSISGSLEIFSYSEQISMMMLVSPRARAASISDSISSSSVKGRSGRTSSIEGSGPEAGSTGRATLYCMTRELPTGRGGIAANVSLVAVVCFEPTATRGLV